jgi:hypothetical protein
VNGGIKRTNDRVRGEIPRNRSRIIAWGGIAEPGHPRRGSYGPAAGTLTAVTTPAAWDAKAADFDDERYLVLSRR